jgi:hypothetical protein
MKFEGALQLVMTAMCKHKEDTYVQKIVLGLLWQA